MDLLCACTCRRFDNIPQESDERSANGAIYRVKRFGDGCDLITAAITLVDAFDEDVLFSQIFPQTGDLSQRLAARHWYFQSLLRATLPHTLCFEVENYGGVCCWFPPGQYLDSFTILRSGFWNAKEKIGPECHERFMEYVLATKQKKQDVMGDVPHYHLVSIGVSDKRGNGLAHALLQPVLRLADKEGVHCYLEATNQQCINVFARLGFRTVNTLVLQNSLSGNVITLMVRDPGATNTAATHYSGNYVAETADCTSPPQFMAPHNQMQQDAPMLAPFVPQLQPMMVTQDSPEISEPMQMDDGCQFDDEFTGGLSTIPISFPTSDYDYALNNSILTDAIGTGHAPLFPTTNSDHSTNHLHSYPPTNSDPRQLLHHPHSLDANGHTNGHVFGQKPDPLAHPSAAYG